MIISMERSWENGSGKKEGQIQAGDEKRETGFKGGSSHGSLMEIDREFVPIEHPLEPPDEDRPLKCPMPSSTLFNGEDTRSERSAERLQKKRVELPLAHDEGMVIAPKLPGLRKRHLALTPGYALPLMLGASQTRSILQILQECSEFDSP